MPPLRTELSELFGRAVILARGVEGELTAAERALTGGDASLALRHARAVLAKVPRSPVALLVAADAAEAAWLEDDAATYLGLLAEVVPWRAEVWLRLGQVRARMGYVAEAREALGRAVASEAGDVGRRAAVALATMDLGQGDAGRALAWLDRAGQEPEVAELRAAALLDRGDLEGARAAAASLGDAPPLDGRRALLVGRLLARTGGDATPHLLRAYVLEEPGAARALAGYVAGGGAAIAETVRPIVEGRGEASAPLFRAAFAEARGDREASRAALTAATEAGDLDAARALASLAIEGRDVAGLALAHETLARAAASIPPIEAALLGGARALVDGDALAALDALDRGGAHPWASALREAAIAGWAPTGSPVSLAPILALLRRAARELDDTPALLATEALAALPSRTARVAVMGEFNAGKSTFVNALLGADIAPTGVLPTTATLHHVVFSPDPFARISVVGGPDRVVLPERLRAALDEVHAAGGAASRVTVGLPLERLRHLELVDTPGFNAPDPAHAAAAREALGEVHLVVWLLDVTQAWKGTERAVLDAIRADGIPVQLVANKLDRLKDDQRAAAIAHVAAGAAETGTSPLAPPLAVSSRLALAGRLGDADALARSGWAAVDAFVEERLVGGAAALRDGALRRAARRILAPLLAHARALEAEDRSEARRENDRRSSLRVAATVLGLEMPPLVRAVALALDAARAGLNDDLAPLGDGTDAGPTARAYARERAASRLSAPLAEALAIAALGARAGDAAAAIAPAISAALAGLVAGLAGPADVAALPTEKLLEAVLPAARDALARESERWTSGARHAAPLVLRLAAIERALSPGGEGAPSRSDAPSRPAA